ncbi:hypothetical protein J6590_050967 [Homalodisca vitripennis]|nr:hypothetical protein J6590_050967 [Homalodisca vitripennis]
MKFVNDHLTSEISAMYIGREEKVSPQDMPDMNLPTERIVTFLENVRSRKEQVMKPMLRAAVFLRPNLSTTRPDTKGPNIPPRGKTEATVLLSSGVRSSFINIGDDQANAVPTARYMMFTANNYSVVLQGYTTS